MLSISEYSVFKKKLKQRFHICWSLCIAISKSHIPYNKNSPRKQVLEHCRGPHYPLLKKIINLKSILSVFIHTDGRVWRGSLTSQWFPNRHILSCLNRTQFYYQVVWTPGRLHREGCGDFSTPFNPGHSPEQSVLPNLAWGWRITWWSSIVPANLNHCQAVVCL